MEHMETLGKTKEDNNYYGIDFLSQETLEFLFAGRNTELDVEEVLASLTADNFVRMLSSTIMDCDDPEVADAIFRFGSFSDVEFIEPPIDEEDFTKTANATELKISSFIQPEKVTNTVRQVISFSLLNSKDLQQLSMIYNPNNLLALAGDLANAHPEGLPPHAVEMVFRYRTILKKIEECQITIGHAEMEDESDEPSTIGNRKWSGYLHPYGHVAQRIDPQEFNAFSDEPVHYEKLRYAIEGDRIVLQDRQI